jgi:hypothetical protein
MELDETDKALIRSFLSTNAAKRWLEYARSNCPKLDLAKTPIENYNASLIIKEGWTGCADFLQNSVQESQIPEYGVRPIDTVSD